MSWYSRLKNALNSRKLDAEIAEELEAHIETLAASFKADGLSDAEAKRQARLRFGNVTRIQERTRDSKIASFAESVIQDVRYTLRSVRKTPGFYATATVSLALAIGAVTAIYSILAAAVLRPLPVRDPAQLVATALERPSRPSDSLEGRVFDYPLYREMQSAAAPSTDLQLLTPGQTVELQGKTARANSMVMVQRISGGGFNMLGVIPALGRLLNPVDDRLPNGSDVAVISFDFWKRHFNHDPGVLGRKLRMNERFYQIVGVAHEDFFGVEPGKFVDVWLPAATFAPKFAFTSRRFQWLYILGRMKSETHSQLAAKLQPALVRSELERARPSLDLPTGAAELMKTERVAVHSAELGISGFRRDFQKPVWIVFSVSISLMLIACVNIASLMLARGTARNIEMALRISLGASGGRLLRQMLTESLTFSIAAGGVGWMLARLLAPLLVSFLSTTQEPIRFALYLDTRALVFSTIASMLAALLFGAFPALQSSRVAPVLSLRSRSGAEGKVALGRWMVSAQVAGAFCLVVVGAAFSFTLWNLLARDKGFDSQNVTVLDIAADRADGGRPDSGEECRQLLARMKAKPGIQAAGAALWPIYVQYRSTRPVIIAGRPRSERNELYYPVSPSYFNALGTKLLAGRDFDERDTQGKQPIPVVVNTALAQRYFDTANAVGRSFETRNDPQSPIQYEIVGVVRNAFYDGMRQGTQPIVYCPLAGGRVRSFTLYLKSPLPAAQVMRMVQDQAQVLGTHVRMVVSLDTLVGNSLLREKLLAGLGTTFGFLSLLLAGIGVFGLLNYSVARRTKELGIRAALGATRRNLVNLVARDLAALMSAGLLIGLVASLLLMPVLRTLFFGIETFDPSVMATAACCFLLAAFIAGGLPARRAASVDPNVALRED